VKVTVKCIKLVRVSKIWDNLLEEIHIMGNVSDENCREYQTIYFMFNNLLIISCRLLDTVE
jgi:hypothetical protein